MNYSAVMSHSAVDRCPPAPVAQNIILDSVRTTVGHTVKCTCKPGYCFVDPSTTYLSLTCDTSKEWKGSLQDCAGDLSLIMLCKF